MNITRALGATLPLLALLSACDRSDPPSERLERAAEELVSDVDSEQLPAQQADGPWAPRNECNALPGAIDFQASLQAAIDTRDADALVALAAEDVKLDFGGGSGRAQLREKLAADDGAFWKTLEQLLNLGCAAGDETSITLPWYFAQTIPVDPYMGAIVTGEDVPLYSAPAADASELATISWDAVERLPDDTQREGFERVAWTRPESEERVEGYIAKDKLRSMIDYRLIANRRNDRWRITALVAGD
ncbi:hypothetical protein [Aurantiacibacter rhizosphaerae]|uniref:Uncharacterized protein n=1 Tax=Aurantiacibacter rhizosphaerae TaxID=2691582 RepID=A0A844XDP6_9SPHN|nr:hypothetical protein [Aurantiacibacter rhizosphaerae]MWV27718.1 hypothetical protein [Aurantiacibacter rhizosphaerae]